MIKKILAKSILTLFLISLFGTILFANGAPTGTPDVYEVTLTKYEISSDNEATWSTLWEGSKTFDITDVDPGEVVGELFSGLRLNPGTYIGRATVSRTFTLKGHVDRGVGPPPGERYAHTQSDHDPLLDGNDTSDDDEEETITIPESIAADSEFVVTDSGSWTVGSSESLAATVSFGVVNTLVYYAAGMLGPDDVFYPSAPKVTVSGWD